MELHLEELRKHHTQVKNDRIEVARIARLCKSDPRHVGFMIDAVDKQKFQIPTTERDTKSLSKLKRIVQKITGVQYFHDDSLHLYNALPDVPTGGNLTLTILMECFKTPQVQRATDVYINFDGASDNICYHVFYGIAYFLYAARQAGWPLQRIYILRFKVIALDILMHSHIHSHAHAHLRSLTYTHSHALAFRYITNCSLCLSAGWSHS